MPFLYAYVIIIISILGAVARAFWRLTGIPVWAPKKFHESKNE